MDCAPPAPARVVVLTTLTATDKTLHSHLMKELLTQKYQKAAREAGRVLR